MKKNLTCLSFFGDWEKNRQWLMRLTVLKMILLMSLLTSYGNVNSQMIISKLKLEEVELSQALEKIEKLTEYDFVFSYDDVEGYKVTVDLESRTLEESMDEILKDLPFVYKTEGDLVIVSFKKTEVKQQQKTNYKVSGKVTDEKGEPIPGVTVLLEGTYTGTATGIDGNFQFSSPVNKGILVISFVGKKTQKINFESGKPLLVKLFDDASDLDEVRVVAYGTTNKREMSGSMSVIDAADLEGIPSPSITNLLQGRVAGMDVTNVSGAPGGGGTQITIRGYNSLGAEAGRRYSNPLWVIDGVPMTSFTSPVTGTNGLSDINPEMIESIHVLKDASSTSLYGARAANGVILVTTKKGAKNQKGKFSVNFSHTYSILPEYPLVYGGKGERDYRIQSRRNDRRAYFDYETNAYKYPDSYEDVVGTYGSYDAYWGNGSAWSPSDGDQLQDSLNTFWNNSTNFYKKLYNVGKVTNANIQTYGGSETMSYSIGAGYYDEKGIVLGSGFNRVNLMGNFMVNPIDRLTVNFNNYLSMSDRSRGTRGSGLSSGKDIELIPGAADKLSTLLPFNSDATTEAIKSFKTQQEKNISYRLRTSFKLKYDFTEHLSFTNTSSLDYSQNNRNSFLPAAMDDYNETKTVGEIARNVMFLNESLLNFKKSFNDIHNITAMLGLSYQRDEYNYIGGSAKNGPSEYIHYAGQTGWPDVTKRSEYWTEGMKNYMSNYSEKKMNSYFGRIDYNYNKKYFLSATLRRDGSSVFGENLKWATFPSVAASWNFSEEDFMEWTKILDFAKLRASYGMSGNVFKNPYLSYGILQGDNIYNGNPSIKPNRSEGFYNPDLSWEETKQFDIGVDLSFNDYRLSVTADYYNRYTDKLLYKVPIPGDYIGYASQWRNAAAISNEGIELEIKYDVYRKDGNYWRLSFNIAKNWNRFAESWNGKDFYDGTARKAYVLGKKLNGIMGLKTDGYWHTDASETAYYDSDGRINYLNPRSGESFDYPGTTKFVDSNNDNVISYKDEVYLGSSLPEITGGIVNEVKWKNFDLNILLSYSLGRNMVNAQPVNSLAVGGVLSPIFINLDEATFWENPGDNTDYPVAHVQNYNHDWNPMQDRFVETVNYLKLKTLTLGYTLPKSIVGKKYFDQVRFFFSGENLLTLTNYSGMDPETVDMTTGIDKGETYPLARKLTLGLTIKL